MARPIGRGNTGRNDRKGFVSDIKHKAFNGQWNEISVSDIKKFKAVTGFTPKQWSKTYGWDQTKMRMKKLMGDSGKSLENMIKSYKSTVKNAGVTKQTRRKKKMT